MRSFWVAAGVLAVAVLSWWGPWREESSPPSPSLAVAIPSREGEGEAKGEPSSSGELTRLTPRPGSLRGTFVDGAYSLDQAGRLLPSPAVLRRFDHFLSASGEEPASQTRARILADIEQQLDEPQAARAVELLDRYLAYREAARELHAEGLADADLATRLQRVRELRSEHLGVRTARLLFEEEDRLVAASLERARIESQTDLDADERRRRLEAAEANLPESMLRARAAARLPSELTRDVAALRESGADADEVLRLREERVGSEAAARLVALDEARRDWGGRLSVYRERRDRLLGGDGAALEDLEALRDEHFAPHERARVQSLDRIDGISVIGEP